eukprot:TRINITY_DN9958_c0_g2_i1.p1 TRINITY_DN9958_c0_g2~~TRINITY_DN9958_c0_g2_i1.p1  ORF type:complete len:419 (-),score=58.78 TRINITY_DN9958_c0_g2_i1:180-1412(-)
MEKNEDQDSIPDGFFFDILGDRDVEVPSQRSSVSPSRRRIIRRKVLKRKRVKQKRETPSVPDGETTASTHSLGARPLDVQADHGQGLGSDMITILSSDDETVQKGSGAGSQASSSKVSVVARRTEAKPVLRAAAGDNESVNGRRAEAAFTLRPRRLVDWASKLRPRRSVEADLKLRPRRSVEADLKLRPRRSVEADLKSPSRVVVMTPTLTPRTVSGNPQRLVPRPSGSESCESSPETPLKQAARKKGLDGSPEDAVETRSVLLDTSKEEKAARRRPATTTVLAERLIHTHLSIPMSNERRQENRMDREELSFFRKLRGNKEYCAGRGTKDAKAVQTENIAASTAGNPRQPADCPPIPCGEVAELLAEIAADAQEYWVNGAWDIESLRDDVAMMRLEWMKSEAGSTKNSM